MNYILKSILLSSALVLCVLLFGVGCVAQPPPPSPAPAEAEAASELGARNADACDQFCQEIGGPFYLHAPGATQTQCTIKGGDWYTADDGYTGPPPGCCCKCTRPGSCL